jgi:hypothetical protein
MGLDEADSHPISPTFLKKKKNQPNVMFQIQRVTSSIVEYGVEENIQVTRIWNIWTLQVPPPSYYASNIIWKDQGNRISPSSYAGK